MVNPNIYSIVVQYGVFSGESCYEARAFEFPDLVEYADSAEEARDLIIDSINTTASIFEEKDKSLPEPRQVETEFSGRITLRLPRRLHRELAEVAYEEGVSLNQFIACTLSNSVNKIGWHTLIKVGGTTNIGYAPKKKHKPLRVVSSKTLNDTERAYG